jgi:hypothetical protein
MTKDEMIGWFKSAPMGSRHQRMLWAAHKIAFLTGATEGNAYQMLLVALIEAEKQLDSRNSMTAHELRRDKRKYEYRSACESMFDWLWLPRFGSAALGGAAYFVPFAH